MQSVYSTFPRPHCSRLGTHEINMTLNKESNRTEFILENQNKIPGNFDITNDLIQTEKQIKKKKLF